MLQAQPEGGSKTLPPDALSRSVNIMRQRVDKLGVSEPDIRTQSGNQIVIDLPGISDPQAALRLIRANAVLEIFDLETSLTSPYSVTPDYVPIPHGRYSLLAAAQPLVKRKGATAYYLYDAHKRPLLKGQPVSANSKNNIISEADAKKEFARLLANLAPPQALLKSDVLLGVPKGTELVSCDKTAQYCPGPNGDVPVAKNSAQIYWYLFNLPAAITGKDLNGSGISADYGTAAANQGAAIVKLSFNGAGDKAFQTITNNEWNRGVAHGTDQHNAIVLDGALIAIPSIDHTLSALRGGIDASGTGAEIDNISSIGQANYIATVLQTGALPVHFDVKATNQISATLGKDSLRQALIAAIAGLLLVVIFLLTLYRFLGLVAVIGLGIYTAFLYGVILLFNVTLTLPSFAGMILTIGVAADANVVIFERIKEEARAGRSVKAAVATGYQRGFHTILDANVVTFITAAVLFLVATAGVKGFALMLMLGTGISLITAVAGTRAMLGLLSNFRWFSNPSFMGAHGAQGWRWLNLDFMRKRYLWFALSGLVLLVSTVSLATRGMNLGIDFKGGSQLTFDTAKPQTTGTVSNIVVAVTHERSAVVQGLLKASLKGNHTALSGTDTFNKFQVRIRSAKPAVLDRLESQLQSKVGTTSPNVQSVSGSFSSTIARSAIEAIIVSFLLITGWVTLRFDFKFAVPVIVAVLHDIVITVGVYSLTGREVTTSTVAAVLTVLGYSIYDTVIIFDRIRENVPLMRNAAFDRIVNVSIWETIRRSLATTFITLLPVGALFIAGGSTLKDFAFALLVGITSGAYSSIFVAAPLLTLWKEREPEYTRRIQLAGYQRGREESVGGAAPQPALATAVEQPQAQAQTYGKYQGEEAAKRERRRQRRRSRPHGRPR